MKKSNKIFLILLTLVYILFPCGSFASERYKKTGGSPQGASSNSFSGDESLSTLVVSGFGESEEAKPDIGQVSLTIRTEEKTAAKASSENARITQNVLGVLAGLGIPKDDIETTSFNISPDFKFDNGKSTIIGYVAINSLSVEVQVDKVGTLIDSVTATEDISLGSINFRLNKENSTKKLNEALTKAVQNARDKADTIAKAAGVKVGDVKNISESSGTGIIPFSKAGFAEASATEIIPGEISVSASVSVTYTLED